MRRRGETLALLARGWTVFAVDGAREAIARLRTAVPPEDEVRLTTVLGRFHAVDHATVRVMFEMNRRSDRELQFDDGFSSGSVDLARWVPYYLPHWSSRELSAAQYDVVDGRLRLLILEDQRPWCPQLDGEVRVSSIQTGSFAGPLGSSVGQHRFSPAAVVREEQTNVRLYTPMYGRVEVRAKALDDPRVMVAFWLIGYEDAPNRSAEICVCEIFGRDVEAESAVIGMGIHPFGDSSIVDDFSRVRFDADVREFPMYAAEWTAGGVAFFIDDTRVKSTTQSPAYPMQLMLGIYEFPADGHRSQPDASPYPKAFVVDCVRGYHLRG